jgi:hypothetical protein
LYAQYGLITARERVLWEGRRRIVDREPLTNREENLEDEDEDSSDSEEQ